MWNAKSSCSPTAAIGDATATTSNRIPSAKSPMRQVGTGWPRRASVRARIAYAMATSAIGASWKGASVQLVSSDTATAPL